MPAAALVTPGGGKLSSEGNWKGRETGTRPPSIPKPSGREGPAEPSRALPADDTCDNCGEADAEETDVIGFAPAPVPPADLCRCP